MNIYLAGTETRADILSGSDRHCKSTWQELVTRESYIGGNLFEGANILQSFYYANDFTENIVIPSCENFMLDSGVFTLAYGSGGKVDFYSYTDKYIEFINKNNVELFFEMDVDDIAGLEKAEELRRRIEKGTGRQPIPIFHKERGKEYFIDMCKNYPYVAIGGIAGKGNMRKRKEYMPFFKWFIDTAHSHGAKIHGLGFTDLDALRTIRFDSVDSTSWTAGNRFGVIYHFDGRTMTMHPKGKGQRLIKPREVAIHNFAEWKKFQQYAKTYM